MRVRCPDCEAGYEIEDVVIGPAGRSLRCAACGGVWWVESPLELQAEEPSARAAPPFPESPAAAENGPGVTREPDEAPAPEPPSRPPHVGPGPVLPVVAARHAPGAPFPAAPGAVDDGRPHPTPPPRAEPAASRTPAGVWVGWVVTFVFLGSAACAAVYYRAEVMAAWPPSEWVYSALGLYKPPG